MAAVPELSDKDAAIQARFDFPVRVKRALPDQDAFSKKPKKAANMRAGKARFGDA